MTTTQSGVDTWVRSEGGKSDHYSVWFGWLHFIRLSDKRLFIKRGRDKSWFNYYFVLVSYIHFPNIAGTLAPFSSSVSKKESPVE